MFYTEDELRLKLDGISTRILHRVIRENPTLHELMEQNRKGVGKKAQYGDKVLEWLNLYFRPKEMLESQICDDLFRHYSLEEEIHQQNQKMIQQEGEIRRLTGLLQQHEAEILRRDEEIKGRDALLEQNNARMRQRDEELELVCARLSKARQNADSLPKRIEAKERELSMLRADYGEQLAMLKQMDAGVKQMGGMLSQKIDASTAKLANDNERKHEAVKKGLSGNLSYMQNNLSDNLEKKYEVVTKRLSDMAELTKSTMNSAIAELKNHDQKMNRLHDINRTTTLETNRFVKEAVWAEVFKSAISQSGWLTQTSFTPGRWAANYAFLYVLFRIMNTVRPKCLLELGLGQTSILVNQYVSAVKDTGDVDYTIVEQSQEWISFFKKENTISPRATITQLPVKKVTFRDDPNVLAFDGLPDVVGDRKFDFVCIDAPGPDPTQTYRRIDALSLIPDHLASSFVILFDDAQQQACQNTLTVLRESLGNAGIAYAEGKYVGMRDLFVIATADWSYLTTL